MRIDEGYKQAIEQLDYLLRSDRGTFFEATMTEDQDAYTPWYARLLSSLALLTDDEEIVFATTVQTLGDTVARVYVFTKDVLISVTIDDVSSEQNPAPVVVSRAAIRSLRLTASMRSDIQGSSRQGWPGTLRFSIEYNGLVDPVSFEAPGVDRFQLQNPAPSQLLLQSLKKDLKNTTTT